VTMQPLGPADRMAKRTRLGNLLATAAELEHGVVCQYLFVAFSMKRHTSEGGVSWAQLELMRQWEAQILLIARQEMEHLGLVSNLLTAIGEAPNFLRPNFPIPSKYYPVDDPPSLEPFGLKALKRLIILEQPAKTTPQEDELFALSGIQLPPMTESVGGLYQEILQLLTDLDTADSAALWIGPPSAQRDTLDIVPVPVRGLQLPPTARLYDVQFEPVLDLPSATLVVNQIIEEGEGAPSAGPESHWVRLLTIHKELTAALKADPTFTPARPVMKDPTRDRISNPQVIPVFDLFDQAYTTVVLMLMRYFGQTDESAPEVAGLQQAAFFPMMTTVLRPLGEILTQLPAGTDLTVRAGAAFTFGRGLAFLPHREAAWNLIGQYLAAMADAADDLSKASGYAAPITARFTFVAENLARIQLNFNNAMQQLGIAS
jgi:ferritin-like protein